MFYAIKLYKSMCKEHCKQTLLDTHPDLCLEWHPIKNGNLEPIDFTFGSQKYIWWQCLKHPSHEWKTSIGHRTFDKTGCPFCSGKKIDFTNSLSTTHSDLCLEWCVDKNLPLTVDQIGFGSHKKVWWVCSKNSNHIWKASVFHRTIDKTDCPYCSGKFVCEDNCLALNFPFLVMEWHSIKNNNLTHMMLFHLVIRKYGGNV